MSRQVMRLFLGFIAATALATAGPLYYVSFDVPGLNYVGGISNNGVVVGFYGSQYLGFERSADGTLQTGISFPGSLQTAPYGVNSAGVIAGNWFLSGGAVLGFTLSGGTFALGPSLVGGDVFLGGINDAGDLAGTFKETEGFLQLAGQTPVLFTIPGAFDLVSYGINNLDQVVGEYRDGTGFHGFIRNPDGSITFVDFPGATSTILTGINDSGVVAGFCTCGGSYLGFYGLPGNLSSFSINTATIVGGINDSGQISGYYSGTDLIRHGFIADVVPEPATYGLLIAGLAILGLVRKTRRTSS